MQTVMIAFIAAAVAGGAAWFVQLRVGKRIINEFAFNAKRTITEVSAQRDQFAKQYSSMRTQIQSMQAAMLKRNGEYDALLKNAKQLAANVTALAAERENTKEQLSTIQNALIAFREQSVALRSEFQKSQTLFKRELQKSFDKRKTLEKDLKAAQKDLKKARDEQTAFARKIESGAGKPGSENDVVMAAKMRLGQIEVLERNVNKLESENNKLNKEMRELRQQYQQAQQDLAEMNELRIHNKQLTHAVEMLEESRKEHETDAERYKRKADESAQVSDTLRFRLADLQKGFAAIEEEQNKVLKSARKASVVPFASSRG